MPGARKVSVALAAVALAVTAAEVRPQAASAAQTATPLEERIQHHRQIALRWERLMGKRHTPSLRRERLRNTRTRRAALEYWRARARKAWREGQRPPHRRAWLCIHRFEGPWDANTGNGYYGGLQMDVTFQRMYGRFLLREKGLAHRWTPLEQMWVAERAYRSGRGFHPWPNTARRCGLI